MNSTRIASLDDRAAIAAVAATTANRCTRDFRRSHDLRVLHPVTGDVLYYQDVAVGAEPQARRVHAVVARLYDLGALVYLTRASGEQSPRRVIACRDGAYYLRTVQS